MRLVDDLAARRYLYSRPLATMPEVLLIDVAPLYASPSLPLGRYYPVLLETEGEYAEMAEFLEIDRDHLVAPDLFDRRLSALLANDIIFARYAPDCADWPWLLLCRWPEDYVAMVPPGSDHFARGAYTCEVFETVEELVRSEARLLETLGSHRAVYLAALPEIAGHA